MCPEEVKLLEKPCKEQNQNDVTHAEKFTLSFRYPAVPIYITVYISLRLLHGQSERSGKLFFSKYETSLLDISYEIVYK